MWYHSPCAERVPHARVVELVDSLASGASARKGVRVRLPPRAPLKTPGITEIPGVFSDRAVCDCVVQDAANSKFGLLTY